MTAQPNIESLLNLKPSFLEEFPTSIPSNGRPIVELNKPVSPETVKLDSPKPQSIIVNLQIIENQLDSLIKSEDSNISEYVSKSPHLISDLPPGNYNDSGLNEILNDEPKIRSRPQSTALSTRSSRSSLHSMYLELEKDLEKTIAEVPNSE
ncbi:hypothetical protein HK096_008423, partial [Nowakowskiella sp. JEL0078]